VPHLINISKSCLVVAVAIFFGYASFAKAQETPTPVKKYSLSQKHHSKPVAHKAAAKSKTSHHKKVPKKSPAKTVKKTVKATVVKEVVKKEAEIKTTITEAVETKAATVEEKSTPPAATPENAAVEKDATEKPVKSKKLISQKLWQGVTANNLEALKRIALSLTHENYSDALKYAETLDNTNYVPEQDSSSSVKVKPDFADAAKDLILWNKFSKRVDPKKVSFSDISRFTADSPFYPNATELRRNVERVAMENNIPYQASEQYFKGNPAATGESKFYLLQSKITFLERNKVSDAEKEQLRNEIKNLIINIWTKENLSPNEEQNFLAQYQSQLVEEDHINRIDRLLWEGKVADAKRIMNLVNDDHKKLFAAVIELQDFPKNADLVLRSVPYKLRSNEGLLYRRVLYYKSKDKMDDLLEVMFDLPKQSRFPEKWWSLRRLYAREMLKQKKYKVAYNLVVNHSLPATAADFWEAQWTEGWIALRFLDQPKVAYTHFETLYKSVTQPISLSRASYWLGMSAQAMGDKKKAIEWYKVSAKYPTFFYGQLAIHKHRTLDYVGAQEDIILPKDPEITVRDMNVMSQSKAAQVAYLLAVMGDNANAVKIFEWTVNNAKSDGQIAIVMKLVGEIGDRQMKARISKVAAKKNVFFVREIFQIVKEVTSDEYAPLVHAIIKQESGFAPTAVSQVGALGFMQLMPATAKLVAKEVGIAYNKNLLASDIKYNVKLGSHYIKKLIDRFDGSEMMAIASYNAGPNAVQRWVNEFYDPRKEKDLDKVVDWIELITYSETRNYVQRIMENLIVYKYLMSRSNYDQID